MKRYPKYKDSGVPWLGQVPAHWEMRNLSHVAAETGKKNTGMVEDNLLSLSYGRIIRKDIKANEGLLPASFEGYQIVESGDTVLRLTDLQNDQRSLRAGFVNERGIITSAYCAVRPTAVSVRWLFNVLRAFDLLKVFYSMGGGVRQSLDYESIKRILMPVPPRAEQLAIDTSLVAEEERIRLVISSQERMIELLKERRSAIITQAVTKGLDPKAKMKGSGVLWLGQVPENWNVKRLRHLVRINASNVDKKTVEGEEPVRLCNYTDVYYNEKIVVGADYMAASATREQIKKLCLKVGDVIITKDSEEPDDIGIPAIVYESAPDLVCGYHLALLRPEDARLGPFIGRAIASKFSKAHFHVNAKGVTRFALGYHAIADLPLVLPPREEARAIAVYLDGTLAKIDTAISSQERMIELLKERRSVIITQAVTGQIDVRE